MMLSDLVRLSVDNLSRRKGRTALTIIGVVVGTCAIVLMISLGIAVNKQNEEMLQSWGDLTQIQVWNYGWSGPEGSNQENTLDDSVMETIRNNEHVVAATPYYQANNMNATVYSGKKNRYEAGAWSIYGAYTDSLEAMGFSLTSGSFFSATDSITKKKIPVLVGENFGYNFEDTKRKPGSPKRYRYQGQTDSNGNLLAPFVDVSNDVMTISIKVYDEKTYQEKEVAKYELDVIGVMASDYNVHYATDSGIIMRIEDIQEIERMCLKASGNKSEEKHNYQEVYIKCDSFENVGAVEKWINDDLGFKDTYSMTQIRESMQQSVLQSQLILGGLAAISLFVAALNIANTMTMAIYERTREIGIMKVLGCKIGAIRSMFLIESGAIGFLGGTIGVCISLLISFGLNNLPTIMSVLGGSVDLSGILSSFGGFGESGGSISIIPPWLILLALLFSTIVGLLSGIIPSNRAVKISALEAIRHD